MPLEKEIRKNGTAHDSALLIQWHIDLANELTLPSRRMCGHDTRADAVIKKTTTVCPAELFFSPFLD